MCVHGPLILVGLYVGVDSQTSQFTGNIDNHKYCPICPLGGVPSPNNLPGAAQMIKIQLHTLIISNSWITLW